MDFQLQDTDKQLLLDLQNHGGWKLLCKDLDERIEEITSLLLTPDLDDILPEDPVKRLNALNQKKLERAYLVGLKNKPTELLNSFVE